MRKSGFTLIELLIVITIMAVLAGALVPMFRVNRLLAQTSKANADLDSIKTASIMYHHDTGQWPAIGSTGAGLINNDSAAGWNGPYLDDWRIDPWGTAYNIFDNGSSPTRRWVRSAGPTAGANITLLITPDTTI